MYLTGAFYVGIFWFVRDSNLVAVPCTTGGGGVSIWRYIVATQAHAYTMVILVSFHGTIERCNSHLDVIPLIESMQLAVHFLSFSLPGEYQKSNVYFLYASDEISALARVLLCSFVASKRSLQNLSASLLTKD